MQELFLLRMEGRFSEMEGPACEAVSNVALCTVGPAPRQSPRKPESLTMPVNALSTFHRKRAELGVLGQPLCGTGTEAPA